MQSASESRQTSQIISKVCRNRILYEFPVCQSAAVDVSKCKNCTLEVLALLREIIRNPSVTQKELAALIGKSERTVKTKTVELQEKGLLRRKNGKRNGQWEVLAEI